MAILQTRIRLGMLGGSRLFREYLANLIRPHADVSLFSAGEVFECTNPPDIILVDSCDARYHMLAPLVQLNSGVVKIIVMNADIDDFNILDCVRLGVVGFVVKDSGVQEIMDVIRQVGIGRRVTPPGIAERICDQLYEEEHANVYSHPPVRDSPLTYREQEIVELIATGLANKQIAERLNIAPHTVKTHVHNVLQKLGMRTRFDIVGHYLRHRNRAQARQRRVVENIHVPSERRRTASVIES